MTSAKTPSFSDMRQRTATLIPVPNLADLCDPLAMPKDLVDAHRALDRHLASLGADSAVPGLNRNMAYMSVQVLPPKSLLDKFDTYAAAIALRVNEITEGSRTLAAVRDTLLPKLISGEMRIQNAKRIIGRVTE